VLGALNTHKGLHGDLMVPTTFVVPLDDVAWPEPLWGMKLGILVRNIRKNRCYMKYRPELEEMGFNF
jgi:hypothetical protein